MSHRPKPNHKTKQSRVLKSEKDGAKSQKKESEPQAEAKSQDSRESSAEKRKGRSQITRMSHRPKPNHRTHERRDCPTTAAREPANKQRHVGKGPHAQRETTKKCQRSPGATTSRGKITSCKAKSNLFQNGTPAGSRGNHIAQQENTRGPGPNFLQGQEKPAAKCNTCGVQGQPRRMGNNQTNKNTKEKTAVWQESA